jgi:FAD/FMN-containing dehydrogenase
MRLNSQCINQIRISGNHEDRLRPFSASAHLASALDIEAEEVIDTACGTNLPRLRAVKQKYDPTNFFRVNYNIKPLSSQAGAA